MAHIRRQSWKSSSRGFPSFLRQIRALRKSPVRFIWDADLSCGHTIPVGESEAFHPGARGDAKKRVRCSTCAGNWRAPGPKDDAHE